MKPRSRRGRRDAAEVIPKAIAGQQREGIGTRIAGLLTRLRLNGGRGSASPDQRGKR